MWYVYIYQVRWLTQFLTVTKGKNRYQYSLLWNSFRVKYLSLVTFIWPTRDKLGVKRSGIGVIIWRQWLRIIIFEFTSSCYPDSLLWSGFDICLFIKRISELGNMEHIYYGYQTITIFDHTEHGISGGVYSGILSWLW